MDCQAWRDNYCACDVLLSVAHKECTAVYTPYLYYSTTYYQSTKINLKNLLHFDATWLIIVIMIYDIKQYPNGNIVVSCKQVIRATWNETKQRGEISDRFSTGYEVVQGAVQYKTKAGWLTGLRTRLHIMGAERLIHT